MKLKRVYALQVKGVCGWYTIKAFSRRDYVISYCLRNNIGYSNIFRILKGKKLCLK